MGLEKQCPGCGQVFVPKSSKQKYCNQTVVRHCKVCGKEFTTICKSDAPEVCSRQCARDPRNLAEKQCEICGDTFHPTSARQKYCGNLKTSKCAVCGKKFEYACGQVHNTCSNQCQSKYIHSQQVEGYSRETRVCAWCGEKFVPINNTQIFCNSAHFRTCEVCGKMFEIDVKKQHKPRTCSKECATKLRFKEGNPFSNASCREKAKQTTMARYGVDHPMRSKEIQDKVVSSYREKTGYDHPSHNPQVRSKASKSSRLSSLESRVKALLDEYKINYMQHHMLTNASGSHEFDFYLSKYNILLDCDRVYYHSYLDDPDGKHVLDYYDEDRLSLVPEGWIFHVIVEGHEDKEIKWIVDCISKLDRNVFDYEGELFKWCRSIEFPRPSYSTERIQKDWKKLCSYRCDKYIPSARLGDSAINQFHSSIYDAHAGNHVSPREAWYDDEMLKKVIRNRLIYKNEVDPYKIMKGFNISKICPKVSVFNPVLARYLVTKYLSEFSKVFDPFSGFSGRLLGVCSTGKEYIGQDINKEHVNESNQLIDFLHIDLATVCEKDILQSSGNYECLLTCSPYGSKEVYGDETVFKSCDDWMDECISRFACNRYVFVVDKTDKYKDFVKEEIKSTSHFCKVIERVVVIDSP